MRSSSICLAAALALVCFANAAGAAAVFCPVSRAPQACRTRLISALQANPPDAMVVLGAMPGACKTRAQGAAAIWHALGANPEIKIIVSGSNPHPPSADLRRDAGAAAVRECGGNPAAHHLSEAILMCSYIRMLPRAQSVPRGSIVLEPRATSTAENATRGAALATNARHILVVTTGYGADYNHPTARPHSHAGEAMTVFCRARSAAHASWALSAVDWPAAGTPIWSYEVNHSCSRAPPTSKKRNARKRH